MGGKSSGSSTVTQKSDPWKGIQPQLLQAAQDTQNLYKQGALKPQNYPGETIAPFSQSTQQAMDLTRQRALNGSPVTRGAQGLLSDTLSGSFLNSNPYLDATFNKAANAVTGKVNSAFNGAGGFGANSSNQQSLARELGNVATDIYGGNYQNERNLQQQAMGYAPALANQDYTDLNALLGVGQSQDTQNQNLINEGINKFNLNQQAPAANIQNYIDLLNGTGGKYGSSSSTQPLYSNPAAGGLGGALGGAQLAGLLGFGGTGMGVGAGIGSLLGLLCDMREKEDIIPDGVDNGHEMYKFRYKGRPARYRGPMAQEVQKKVPEAVHELGGRLYVDCNMIGVEITRLPN